jgi:hypothetical protein
MDQELKQHLEAMESRMDSRLESRLEATGAGLKAYVDTRLVKAEEHLTEKMRDMQTELLRGFASFSESQNIRLRKVEADFGIGLT